MFMQGDLSNNQKQNASLQQVYRKVRVGFRLNTEAPLIKETS